jgi:hypothetical protein
VIPVPSEDLDAAVGMLRNLVPEHEITNDHYLYTLWTTRGGTSPDDLEEEHIPALRASREQIRDIPAGRVRAVSLAQKLTE